jgi:D-arabinose 1-dehydrogenase-like Zn-dependent alcohol dehydrogenase
MKAAIFRGAGLPLCVEDVPDPVPAAGEVLIRVAACGVCHTDLHYIDHGTPTFKPPPLILGHEISGTVAALGPGVSGHAVGERVLAAAVVSCGRCEPCRMGRENLCDGSVMLGNTIDGGYAELVRVPAKDVFHLTSCRWWRAR